MIEQKKSVWTYTNLINKFYNSTPIPTNFKFDGLVSAYYSKLLHGNFREKFI